MMTTKTQLGWRELFLILTLLPCGRSLQVSIPEQEYSVTKGEDVTLTCNFVPARPVTNALVLTWEAFPDNEADPMKAVATFFLGVPVDIAPAYEGRAALEVVVHDGVSKLHLAKVTVKDSRRYQCSVLIPNDDEGTPAATTSLLVLEPPSPPVCGIQGRAEYGQDVSLTCLSEEGSPKPTYAWRTYSVDSVAREFPPKTTEKEGLLSLFNLTREMSGFFICTSTNPVASASCNLTLSVTPVSMNAGSTAGIVVGVLLGVVLVGILVFCFCRNRNKKKDPNDAGSPAEMEFRDTDAPQAEPYRDDQSAGRARELSHNEDEVPRSDSSVVVSTSGQRFEEDRHSQNSGAEGHGGRGSGHVDAQPHTDSPNGDFRGGPDHLAHQQERHGGSREHLDI